MTWPPRPWLIALALALLGTIVFAPAITGDWIYDDKLLVAGNRYVHSFSDWPHWFVSDFWNISDEVIRTPGRIAYWRPAVSATYALDWSLSGGASTMFHITNLVWHALVGGLTFVVLRRWLGDAALWPAVISTLLFLVHPTKAESVAWISGRTDVICMAAVLIATQGVARRLRGEHGGVLLESAGTVLAYMSKEQAIVLPAFVMIEAWVAGGRKPVDWRGILGLVRAALPQIVIAAVYLGIRAAVMPIKAIELPSDHLALVPHAVLVLESLGRFVSLAFVPRELSVQHGLVHFVDGQRIADTGYVALGALALLVFVATAFLLRRRMPGVTIGITFFLVTLAPTLNIVNTQMITVVSERFLYLPVLGLVFALGTLLVERPHRVLTIFLAVAIAAMSAQALRRSYDFADEQRFWERELELHPDSGEARRGRVRTAFLAKKYRTALYEVLEILKHDANRTLDVGVAVGVADLVARLTPDRDRMALETIDAFCRDMLDRKQPEAVLRLPTLEFKIATGSRQYEREMVEQTLPLLGLRSTIHSRLGDDAGALALAQAAVDKCPRCETALITATLALTRGGKYDEASALLAHAGDTLSSPAVQTLSGLIAKTRAESERAEVVTGPEQLRARAAAFSTLELWGRAFAVLEPYKDQIKLAPKFRIGFAELAFRAGEPQLAREVLGTAMQPAEIETTLANWALAMGWDEGPRPGPEHPEGR